MPRTFTLQRLMLVLTLFCTLCGIAAAYPLASLAYILLLSLFTPTLIVCQVLVSSSSANQRMTTLLIALSGAFLGLIVGTPIDMRGYPVRNVWQAIEPYVVPTLICPALGAAIFGGAALADDCRRQHPPTEN